MSATDGPSWLWYLMLSSCALTDKQPALNVHYYSMSPPSLTSEPLSPSASSPNSHLRLVRISRVKASSHLNKKLYFRSSAVEGGYYEDRRWTEKPAELVHRELDRALFEQGRFSEQLAGDALVLEVEVLAFEEVRLGASRHALIELRYQLQDDSKVLLAQTVRVERAAKAPAPEEVVKALSLALEEACQELAVRLSAAAEPGQVADESASQ